MGDEDPCAAFGFFVSCGGDGWLREDGDAAGARAGGEETGVGVDGVEKGDYGCVYGAFW